MTNAKGMGGGGGVVVAVIVLGLLICCCCGRGGGAGGGGGGGGGGGSGSTGKYYCDGPFTAIKNPEDLSRLAACGTYGGSVKIDSNFNGSLTLGDSLKSIAGDLKCSGASELTSISAPSLSNVGGSVIMNDLSSLTSLDLNMLAQIDGALSIQGLPSLQSFSIARSLSEVGGLTIKGNISSSYFPSLQQITGNSRIVLSTNDDSFCQFVRMKSSSGVRISCVTGSRLLPDTAGIIAGVVCAGMLILGASVLRQRFIMLRRQREPEPDPAAERVDTEAGRFRGLLIRAKGWFRAMNTRT